MPRNKLYTPNINISVSILTINFKRTTADEKTFEGFKTLKETLRYNF